MGMERELEQLLAGLNAPQREAVRHGEGPLLVLAGPGSGKTRVITNRAAHLVRSGVAARNVLAITFTNKAADEMRRRVERLGVSRGMWVYTFHALGARLLREFGPLADVEPGFSIYDQADQLRLVKEALEICGIAETAVRPAAAQARISRAKSQLQTPEMLAGLSDYFVDQYVARAYEAYDQLLRQRNAVDFDDLLMRVATVLRDHPDVTERLNVRFRFVLIDEYQDTNHAQYLIAKFLSQHHRNICATGDPDQSIYAWRGASLRNILEFERDYPDAVVVRLEQNYRSTPNILRVADRLIQGNKRRKHKKLWTELQEGAAVHVWQFPNGYEEADRIAEQIRTMHAEGRPYSDFAVFYRINALSRTLEESLRRREIPYRIARGVEFYSRKEIKDTLAYLRVLVNPADDIALLRIINTPTRGIGKTTIERLRAEAATRRTGLMEVLRNADRVPALKTAVRKIERFVRLLDEMEARTGDSVSEAVEAVVEMSGLERMLRSEDEEAGEDRLANVQELVSAADRYEEEAEEPTLADFLHRISLVSDQDAVDESAGCVMLMTLHAAKGLEFPAVFLVGLEQGMLPHERALSARGEHQDEDDVEEERRLCFVGVTRAREELFLSFADERTIRGVPMPRAMSQFVYEMDDGSAAWENYSRRERGPGSLGPEDGFVPTDDDLPAESAWRLRRGKRKWGPPSDDPDEVFFDPDGRRIEEGEKPQSVERSSVEFADWQPGLLVQHDRYGVGQLLWVRPGPGQTRARIRFAGVGEKTFVLELSPVRPLQR